MDSILARAVIGADGAKSQVGRSAGVKGCAEANYVFAYHEIVKTPAVKPDSYNPDRCDVFYQKPLSPDFYGWVFPHGDTLSIGTAVRIKVSHYAMRLVSCAKKLASKMPSWFATRAHPCR